MDITDSWDTGRTKTGIDRTVPVHPELLPHLAAYRGAWAQQFGVPPGEVIAHCPAPKLPPGFLFPAPLRRGGYTMPNNQAIAQQMRRLLRDAEIRFPDDEHPDLRRRRPLRPTHLLRHTFITLASEAGVSPLAVERIAGHSFGGRSKTTARYRHLQLPFLQEEVAKLRIVPA